jgi:hypothetical protein
MYSRTAATIVFALFLSSQAQARYIPDNNGRYVYGADHASRRAAAHSRPYSVALTAGVRKARHRAEQRLTRTHRHERARADANGNAAYATVHTASGLTAKVAASAQSRFQRFIDIVEADSFQDMGVGYFVDAKTIPGNRISDLGCLAHGGHMPLSKHYRGLACDFGQIKRNITTDKFMYHVSDIAHEVGLTDGCEWGRRRGERYTGADCGHLEVPGPTRVTRTASARRHHHRRRYANR